MEQPDGKYAVWSTVVEGFVLRDATREQILQWYVGKQATEAYQHMNNRLLVLENGEVPYQGSVTTWDDVEERHPEVIDDE